MSAPLLGSPLPIAAAPMAGGLTTPALSAAVAAAGAFPFLAGGYKTPGALAAEIEEARGLGVAFGVNLFVPSATTMDEPALAAYAQRLRPEAERMGAPLGAPPASAGDDDSWPAKLRLLVEHPVPLVSLTFGLPPAEEIAELRAAGSTVLATVTSVTEAELARRAGVDGLVVQGFGAGGHSAVFDPAETPAPITLTDLVAEVIRATDLPVVAAGGVDGPAAVRRLLGAGASAVAVGTLLLRTDEAGTSAVHRAALVDPALAETVLTRAFTGRPARALRNGFVDRHDAEAPTAYPAVHHLTRPLRQAAAEAGDPDALHLWAGTGHRTAPSGPAIDVIRWLAGEA